MNRNFAISQIATARSSRRRFFTLLGGGVLLAATPGAARIGGFGRAEANEFKPLWHSADVLIGNSPKDQIPNPFIKCPMFFEDGRRFANAYHTLDLSDLANVRGGMIVGQNTITPDFSSMAVEVAEGTDGIPYLVVAGEGIVKGGTGYFLGVSRAIVRCKYKVAALDRPDLLVSCIYCVIILVRK